MRHTKRLDNSIVSSPLRDIYFPICPHYSYYIFYNADNILSIVFPDIIINIITKIFDAICLDFSVLLWQYFIGFTRSDDEEIRFRHNLPFSLR